MFTLLGHGKSKGLLIYLMAAESPFEAPQIQPQTQAQPATQTIKATEEI